MQYLPARPPLCSHPVPQVSTEPSEEAIKGTLDYLHQKAKSSGAVTVTEPDAVRPMMEVRQWTITSYSVDPFGCRKEGRLLKVWTLCSCWACCR